MKHLESLYMMIVCDGVIFVSLLHSSCNKNTKRFFNKHKVQDWKNINMKIFSIFTIQTCCLHMKCIIVAKNNKYNITFWHIGPTHLVLLDVKPSFQMRYLFSWTSRPKNFKSKMSNLGYWCQFKLDTCCQV